MTKIFVVYWWWVTGGKRDHTKFEVSTSRKGAESLRSRVIKEGVEFGRNSHERVVSVVTEFRPAKS